MCPKFWTIADVVSFCMLVPGCGVPHHVYNGIFLGVEATFFEYSQQEALCLMGVPVLFSGGFCLPSFPLLSAFLSALAYLPFGARAE